MEEVVQGTSWEKAWSFLPVPDPCAQWEMGSLSMEQYEVAVGYQKGVQEILQWRQGGKGDRKGDKTKTTTPAVDATGATATDSAAKALTRRK